MIAKGNSINIVYRLVWIVILLTGSRCMAGTEPSTSGKHLDRVTLQLKWKHQFQFAGYYAALEKGFYRDAGLDVRIIEATAGHEATENVILGDAEFGIGMSDLVQLRAKGKPIVALATIFQHSPSVILSLKKNGIENIHSLAGKRIALEDHSEQLLAYFESEGIPRDKMTFTPHDYDITKLISGEVDAISAYSTDEPFLLLEKGIEYNTFSPRAGGIDFYGDTLFTSEHEIKHHRKRVDAFLAASLKGWDYALEHSEEIIDLILTRYSTRHSREHLQYEATMSKKLIMQNVVELGYMNPGRWIHIADTFKELEIIPNDFSIEGFVYKHDNGRQLRQLYLMIAAISGIATLCFMIAARFYKLSRRLKHEVDKRQEYIDKLGEANSQIKSLKGIIPICMYCKGIRDDKGYWNQLEAYIADHSEVTFTHGVCESCLKKQHPDYSAPEDPEGI
jgi:ABC-type nitrate/sulfonate/bicarbonate transport system substrate-binding protein